MEIKLQHHQSFLASSTSNPCFSQKPIRIQFFCNKVVFLNHKLCNWGNSRKKCLIRHGLLEYDKSNQGSRWVELKRYRPTFCKARRMRNFCPLASGDDGVTVNGTSQSSPSSDVEEMRIKLNQTLQGEDYSDGLIQSLHDAARVFELGVKERSSLSRNPWFSTAWLGVDKNAWVKSLSYQAALYSFLQAASEISSRGDRRDRDINVSVQRSLLRLSAPLDSLIRDELSAKQPETYEWFWSEQLPMVVTTFVNYFERDPRFTEATSVFGKGLALPSGCASDISLLMLALTCIAAITKLGPAKASCSQFFSLIPDETGRLMDMLTDFIPIRQTYYAMKDIGLRREFLVHFGPRAASCRVNDRGTEELAFWVELVQQQLQRAIAREKIWSRLTTCESIEVIEKDLAIFGFFIALGRSTQSFLSANHFVIIDDPIESFIRYLIGGSVLYYPQLSSISSYQLYVEVVCEELEWLPFYPGDSGKLKRSRAHGSTEGPPNTAAIPVVLDVSSYWMQSFIKYSTWLENPSNIKAAKFLSRGHNKLKECTEDLEYKKKKMNENGVQFQGERFGSGSYSPTERELDAFDKALENVEEALKRLEGLLQELHVSSSKSGKEHLEEACSDLERIRKLKKEAEFLEASFRAKAASFQQGDDGLSPSSISNQDQYSKRQNGKSAGVMADKNVRDGIPADRVISNPRGLWSFLMRTPSRKSEPGPSTLNQSEGEFLEQATTGKLDDAESESESNEIRRFELLRHELIQLEKRVQRSSLQSENEEDINIAEDITTYGAEAAGLGLVQVQKKESFINQSIDKLKSAGTLRHLYLGDSSRSSRVSDGPLGIGNLRNLKTLNCIHTGDWIKETDLLNLTNLCELGIRDLSRSLVEVVIGSIVVRPSSSSTSCLLRSLSLKLSDSYEGFPNLEPLTRCSGLSKLTLNGIITQTKLDIFPSYLTKLSLINSELGYDPMGILQHLPNLVCLRLCSAYVGEHMVCRSKGFPKLQFLLLSTLQGLEEWAVEKGGMPCLRELSTCTCRRLKMLPEGQDVWQGSQLLAIDAITAMGLLSRALTGDEITDKEKQALRRTLTDLASVVPIGFLMLLPVSAVGHAAMLAAIKKYVPALIPSTYGPERLDLLRKLEKMKEMKPDETLEGDSLIRSSPDNS